MTGCYENRELSWLRFNERVLEEAEDERVPLCERLSFLSIFQSNLDEFFMVRVGSLHDQNLIDPKARDGKTNLTAAEQIEKVLASTRQLCKRRDRVYGALMDRLGEIGISLINFHTISGKAEKKLASLFKHSYLPYLSSIVVSKKQAFPVLNNKEIYAVCVLANKADISPEIIDIYLTKEGKNVVDLDREAVEALGAKIIEDDIFCIDEARSIRHDAMKTAFLIFSYLMGK